MRQHLAVCLAVCLGLATAIGACGPHQSTTPTPDRLTVTAAQQIVSGIGKTTQLTVYLWHNNVSTNVSAETTWSSNNATVGTVSPQGLVTAVGSGVVLVTAHYQTLTSTISIAVSMPAVVSLSMPATLSVTSTPDVRQLAVTAVFSDQTTKDVTDTATLTSSDNAMCALAAHGELHINTLGRCTVSATYNNMYASTAVTATPPGTIAIDGRARLPGSGQGELLGVPGFLVTNTKSGDTVVTDSLGHYTMGNIVPPATFRFEKAGYEPAEIVVTVSEYSEASVQQIFQLNAGGSVATTISPNDMSFNPAPGLHCFPCRMIRVTAPGAGTLSITASGADSFAKLSLFVNGSTVSQSKATVSGDFAVSGGEVLVYVQVVNGGHDKVTVSTTFTPAGSVGHSRP